MAVNVNLFFRLKYSFQSVALISDWRNAVSSTQTNQIKITLVVSRPSSLVFSLTAHYCAATSDRRRQAASNDMMSFRPGSIQNNGVMSLTCDEASPPRCDTRASHFYILLFSQKPSVRVCVLVYPPC